MTLLDVLIDDPDESPALDSPEPPESAELVEAEEPDGPEEPPLAELVALEEAPPPYEGGLMTAAQEQPLMARLQAALIEAGGNTARLDGPGREDFAVLCEANRRLVKSLANRYANAGVARDDLEQEGMIGLFRAVTKFNPALGFRFSTYAMWWIRQAILQASGEQRLIIRVPVHAVDQLNRTKRCQARLSLEGRPHDAAAVAEELGMRPVQVLALWRAARQHVSLEAPRYDDDDLDLRDLLAATDASPDDVVQQRLTAKAVDGVLRDALCPRDRRIIMLRNGLGRDGEVYSLQVVGDQFGLSRERVRQIEGWSLAKLQAPHILARLADYRPR